MGVVARSERDKYSGWPPPIKAEPPKQELEAVTSEGLVTMARKRRKAEKATDDNGA